MSDIATISVIVSGVTACISLATSIFIAFINNSHQRKMKEIELYTEKRNRILEDYVKEVGVCIFDEVITQNYFTLKDIVVLYAPPEVWQTIEDLDTCLQQNQFKAAERKLSILCHTVNIGNRIGAAGTILKNKFNKDHNYTGEYAD